MHKNTCYYRNKTIKLRFGQSQNYFIFSHIFVVFGMAITKEARAHTEDFKHPRMLPGPVNVPIFGLYKPT